MHKDWSAIAKELSGLMGEARKSSPEPWAAFSGLAKAATAPGALDAKTKELIALSIGVATRCDGCIGFHAEALVKLGTSRAEFEEALGMAGYMGGGPALMYAADAITAFEQFQTLATGMELAAS